MTLFQKKIWICLMGFSVLPLFNVNHAFAKERSDLTEKEQKIERMGNLISNI